MNIYQAPYAWVMRSDHRSFQQLVDSMERFGGRGENWDYERDADGLVKFGFASRTALGQFRSVLRHYEAAVQDTMDTPRRTAH